MSRRLSVSRRLALSILFLIGTLFAIVSFTSPQPMITFTGRSEIAETITTLPDSAAFSIPYAFLIEGNRCLSKVHVRPRNGTRVIYEVLGPGELLIVLVGSATVQSEELDEPLTADFQRFIVSFGRENCSYQGYVRLPLTGLVQIGEEPANSLGYGDKNPILRHGRIQVFGRSISRLLFIIPLNWGPFDAEALYLAEIIDVPAGSRVSHALDEEGNPVRWWGFAEFNMSLASEEAPSLFLSASANAGAVSVFAPAPRRGSVLTTCQRGTGDSVSEPPSSLLPECISLDLSAQLAGDPNLRWIYGALIVMVAFANLLHLQSEIKTDR